MSTLQLIDNAIPQLTLEDSGNKALQLIADYKCTHLPVVNKDKYLGLISEDDLLDKNREGTTLELFQSDFVPVKVMVTLHFLKAVPLCNLYHTNIIPVVNETDELLGCIRSLSLINALGNFCGANELGGLIVIEMEPSRLAISEINSIVESDGATILHLNVSPIASGQLQVTIQINKREISTIIASFGRYEYSVVYYSGEELFENDLATNYQNLMTYLQI
ncbi:MAG: CBS domain-containing protein [Ginsengibacter sp.]